MKQTEKHIESKTEPASVARRPISPRTKKIIVVCVLIAVAVIAATVTAVVLILQDDRPGVQPGTPTGPNGVFYLAAPKGEDFVLPSDWVDPAFSSFRVEVSDPELVAVSDFTLKRLKDPESECEVTVRYLYGNKQVAVYVVRLLLGDAVKIASTADFTAIPAATTATYIQTADFALPSSYIPKKFGGRYYANGYRIDDLRPTAAGGLFASVENAVLDGIALHDVKASVAGVENAFGVLAATASNSDIVRCTVTGEISVSAETGVLYVGGLVGKATDKERRADEDPGVNVVKDCTVDLKLAVRAPAPLSAGGLIGYVTNVSVSGCSVKGTLTVDLLARNAPVTEFPTDSFEQEDARVLANIGGAVGAMNKYYRTASVQNIHFFDDGVNVTASNSVTVNAPDAGSAQTIVAGGIYGVLRNHNLNGCKFDGTLSVSAPDSVAVCGGTAGRVYNTMRAAGDLNLYLRNLIAAGTLQIAAANVIAGGIAGVAGEVPADHLIDNTASTTASIDAAQKIWSDTVGRYDSAAG